VVFNAPDHPARVLDLSLYLSALSGNYTVTLRTKTCRTPEALSSLGCTHVFSSFMQTEVHLVVTSDV
jgi:hypothetical protein